MLEACELILVSSFSLLTGASIAGGVEAFGASTTGAGSSFFFSAWTKDYYSSLSFLARLENDISSISSSPSSFN